MIESIIQTTLESFDFSFCIVVNVLTYLIIRIVTEYKPKWNLTTWLKRVILICVLFSMGVVYYAIGTNIKLLLNSAILAPVFWSWIMKPICKVFDIDYKDIDVFD
jgi:hypothetical protein